MHIYHIVIFAKKILFFSLCLIWAGFFLGCDSPGKQTNVSIVGTSWYINREVVNEDSPAEGLLMNVRMVNTAFEDESQQIHEYVPDFDPEENTNRFIRQIPDYVANGINGFTISLQGGLPGYEGAINSAFNTDGSLRATYMNRIDQIIQAADAHGAVVILTCFYQRQHSHKHALDGKQAIRGAVSNVARWVSDQQYTNIVLEISNEYAHGGFTNWKDGEWLSSVEGQVELIRHAKTTAPGLLVSTSGMGNGTIAGPIARAADFVMIHFNNTALSDIPERIEQASAYGKPVLCNEDDKIGQAGAEAARLSVTSGAGWGFMHMEKNQYAPFEFDGAADDSVVYHTLSSLTSPGESIDRNSDDQLSVLITEPKDGDIFPPGSALTIRTVVTGIEGIVGPEIHVYDGDQFIGKSTSFPWEVTWERVSDSKHRLTAVVRNADGQEVIRSRLVDFEVTSDKIFPEGEWQESAPESQGVDAQKLHDAVQYLKNNSGPDGVNELVIIRNGHLIWKGSDIDKVHNVWSLTKSFTSTVLGLLIDDGKVTIDTRASSHIPELFRNYSDVTLLHFTTMTSGYTAKGDEPDVSHGQSDTPFSPSANPLFAPPGSRFAYWDSAVNQFAHVLTRAAGEPIEELFRRKIADPIGMDREKWDWRSFKQEKWIINGGAGNKGKGIHISASELARFGLLFLNRGGWNDKSLISASWVNSATTVQVPASVPLAHPQSDIDGSGVYGYNWWVNDQGDGNLKWPGAPSGTYAASGFNNNDMFIIPEWEMVVVRLGLDQNEFEITDGIYSTFLQKVGKAVK